MSKQKFMERDDDPRCGPIPTNKKDLKKRLDLIKINYSTDEKFNDIKI